jgi:hypothetical protein
VKRLLSLSFAGTSRTTRKKQWLVSDAHRSANRMLWAHGAKSADAVRQYPLTNSWQALLAAILVAVVAG